MVRVQIGVHRQDLIQKWAGPTGVTLTRISTERRENNNPDSDKTTPKVMKFTSKKRRGHRRPKHKKNSEQRPPNEHQHTTYSEERNADIDKTITILQLGSASMLRLNVKVSSKTLLQ